MTITSEQSAFLRQAAEKVVADWPPLTDAQIAALAPIIGPAWHRVKGRERQERPELAAPQRDAAPENEAA